MPRWRQWVVASGIFLFCIGFLLYVVGTTRQRWRSRTTPETGAGLPATARPADDKPVEKEYVWPADKLKESKIAAPDLSKVTPILDEDFAKPGPRKVGREMRSRYFDALYERGRYVVTYKDDKANAFSTIPVVQNINRPFAYQVVARCTGKDGDGWGVTLKMAAPKDDRGVSIKIGRDGAVSRKMLGGRRHPGCEGACGPVHPAGAGDPPGGERPQDQDPERAQQPDVLDRAGPGDGEVRHGRGREGTPVGARIRADAEPERAAQGVPVDRGPRLPVDRVDALRRAVDGDADLALARGAAGELPTERIGHGDAGQVVDQRLAEADRHDPWSGRQLAAGLGLGRDERRVCPCLPRRHQGNEEAEQQRRAPQEVDRSKGAHRRSDM